MLGTNSSDKNSNQGASQETIALSKNQPQTGKNNKNNIKAKVSKEKKIENGSKDGNRNSPLPVVDSTVNSQVMKGNKSIERKLLVFVNHKHVLNFINIVKFTC